MGLIGVRDLTFGPLSKKDLLLFDQIAIPELHRAISGISDKSKVADLEWLIDQGILFEVSTEGAMDKLLERGIGVPFHRYFWQSVIIIAAILHMGEQKPEEESDVDMLFRRGLSYFFDYGLRCVALELQEQRKMRAVPILESFEESDTRPEGDLMIAVEKINRSKDVVLEKIEVLDEQDKEVAKRALEHYEYFTNSKLFNPVCLKDCPFVGRSDVVGIVLKALPFPDETVPLDKLVEFKNHEKTKMYLENLRKWLRKIGEKNLSAMEIEEEIQYLISSYEDHMRFQKMKIRKKMIETFIATPLQIAEDIMKIKWGDIAHSLFSLNKLRVDLMEAERNAPGREIAYIIKAKEEFAHR